MASSNGNIFPPPGDFAIRVTATAAVGGGSAVAAGGAQCQQDRIITTRRRIPLKRILRDGNAPSFEMLKNSLKRFYGESFRLTYSDPLDGEMIDMSEDDELLDAIEQFSSTGTVLNLNLTITAQQQQQQQQQLHLNNNNNDIIIQAASPIGGGGTGYRNRDHQQASEAEESGTDIQKQNTSDNASAGEEPTHPHFTKKKKKKKPTIDRESPNEKAADAPTRKRGISEVLVGTSSRSRKSTRKKAAAVDESPKKKQKAPRSCKECGWNYEEHPEWHPKKCGFTGSFCACPDREELYNRERMRMVYGELVYVRADMRNTTTPTVCPRSCKECGWNYEEHPEWHPKKCGFTGSFCACPDIEKYHNPDRMKRVNGKLVYVRRDSQKSHQEKRKKAEEEGKKKDGDRK